MIIPVFFSYLTKLKIQCIHWFCFKILSLWFSFPNFSSFNNFSVLFASKRHKNLDLGFKLAKKITQFNIGLYKITKFIKKIQIRTALVLRWIVPLDLTNGSFGLGVGRVLVQFGSNIFGSVSGLVRVWVTFESIMFGRVRVLFGSGLFWVVYSSPVQIGYRSYIIWVGWDLVQCLGECRVGCKSGQVQIKSS